MYTLKILSPGETERAYEGCFREAFPPEELKPLDSILSMSRSGFYETRGLFAGDEPLAYACLWRDGNHILIDYLCVPAEKRGGGFGSAMLALLRESFPPESIFFAEVEAPTGAAEEDEAIFRRLEFYARSGALPVNYDCALFGVHYRMLCWSAAPVDEAELQRRHDGLYRRWFSPELYAKAIQIPLRPGEKPFDRRQWEERPESEEEL